MCSTCGCGETNNGVTISVPGEENLENNQKNSLNDHHHKHDHTHHHHPEEDTSQKHIHLEEDILRANNLVAERNRGFLEARNILAFNLVSSPGSGKTALLERMIRELKDEFQFYIIEGDQQSMNDADRITATGAPVVQINTGSGCHLDAVMVNKALKKLDPESGSVLMIENVGNLVCPALFDLGENRRIVIMSVTEGDDKPLKYPTMFETSDVCIINKTDLLPYVDFDIEKAKEYALRVNHHMEFFELSAKSGGGLEKWHEWLKKKHFIPG